MLRELVTALLMIVMVVFTSPTGEMADNPVVKINQPSLSQGQTLIVKIANAASRPEGTFLDKSLKFSKYQNGWLVFFGISYWTEPGEYPINIKFVNGTEISQTINITKGNFKESYLTVTEEQQKIVQPTEADQEIIQRKEADNELIAQAYSQSEPVPLWSEPFIRPVEGHVTTGYGFTRYVNGKVNNRHSGLDIANAAGTPIYAVNNGIVRLAENLLVTGNTTIIDHGGGVFSSYAHQSELLVQAGDVVQKGQLIGKMGSTGFSTGSHLHWVMRIGSAYLNPDYFVGRDLIHDAEIVIP